jgi:hypothetical protein
VVAGACAKGGERTKSGEISQRNFAEKKFGVFGFGDIRDLLRKQAPQPTLETFRMGEFHHPAPSIAQVTGK